MQSVNGPGPGPSRPERPSMRPISNGYHHHQLLDTTNWNSNGSTNGLSNGDGAGRDGDGGGTWYEREPETGGGTPCPPSPRRGCKTQKRKKKGVLEGGAVSRIGFDDIDHFLLDEGCGERGKDKDNAVDLDFTYGDADNHIAEMGELYSYNETSEFNDNFIAYETFVLKWDLPGQWKMLEKMAKVNMIQRLLDQLDLCDKAARSEAVKAILYIAQGCWSEIRIPEELEIQTQENVLLLVRQGTFSAIAQLLILETDSGCSMDGDLPTILNILYTLVETIRSCEADAGTEEAEIRSLFISQLNDDEGGPLVIKLWKILTTAVVTTNKCHPPAVVPFKKILLLLWKVMLLSFGGHSELLAKKTEYRSLAGLPYLPVHQDTLEIGKNQSTMQTGEETVNSARKVRKSLLMRQNNVNQEVEALTRGIEFHSTNSTSSNGNNNNNNNNAKDDEDEMEKEFWKLFPSGEAEKAPVVATPTPRIRKPRESGTLPACTAPRITRPHIPWAPKVRLSELETFLQRARAKYIGISLPGDLTTEVGLPPSISECTAVQKQHIYLSLSEWYMNRENELRNRLLSGRENENELERACQENPMNALYEALLPDMAQHIIVLLKIFLTAALDSSKKPRKEIGEKKDEKWSWPVNVIGEVYNPRDPTSEPSDLKEVDITRHKEIITKAISGILLLFLKHSKLANVFQFECIAQHLMFANCIPLILRYLSQNMHTHITTMTREEEFKYSPKDLDLGSLEFPACVLTSSEWKSPPCAYSRRNLLASINLLRVLNKLCKWKTPRVLMLVSLQATSILQRGLCVRHPVMQLYILKLIKMQVRHMAPQWRRSHVKVVGAIYHKVRGHLNENWLGAYDHGAEAESGGGGWEGDCRDYNLDQEECKLWTHIELYHKRRFGIAGSRAPGMKKESQVATVAPSTLPEFEPAPAGAYDIEHVLASSTVRISPGFKAKYEQWLEKEVFQHPIDWDELIQSTNNGL